MGSHANALRLAYAVYFDHKRQTDPEFRKALKRESKRTARAAKIEAEAHGARQKEAIKDALEEAKEQGFPTEIEEKEAYFMQEVSRGETLCQDGLFMQTPLHWQIANIQPESKRIEAATSFYRALKVYPSPKDLIGIYDKTVPKPVIDILAEMIALDPDTNFSMSPGGSDHGDGEP